MKCYVVFKGRKPGVYNTWVECHDQISRFSGNLHWSYGSRKEGEEVYAQFEAMESAKRLGYPHPDGIDGRELRHVRQFAIKDVILCVLVIVVLIQSYLLYKE